MTPGFIRTRYQKDYEKVEGWTKEAEASIKEFDDLTSILDEQEKKWGQLLKNGYFGRPVYGFDELRDQIKKKDFTKARTRMEDLSKMIDAAYALLSRRDYLKDRLHTLLDNVSRDPELDRYADKEQIQIINEKLNSIQLEDAEKGISELGTRIAIGKSVQLEKKQLNSRLEDLKKRWRAINEKGIADYPFVLEKHISVLLDSGDTKGSKLNLDQFEKDLLVEEEKSVKIENIKKAFFTLNNQRDQLIQVGSIDERYTYQGDIYEAIKNNRIGPAEELIEKNRTILNEIKRLGEEFAELKERWNDETSSRGRTDRYRDEPLIHESLQKGDIKYAQELMDRFEKKVMELEAETATKGTSDTKEVFISYATEDKNVAFAVCHALEQKKIRCWIAPRDVLPGENYGKAIIGAINTSQIMVLIFSSNSNYSQQVLREVERAVSKGIVIVPLRIEEVLPSDEFEYFISSSHWLDAITKPFEEHVNKLTNSVVSLLDMIHKNGK
ncbi:MAG: TIR domain-containing protein [Candidatus Thermoplasmatota archaeon]|nr:TIR domain-containing protein [Candidatus Thermoplasmatota archaeon]